MGLLSQQRLAELGRAHEAAEFVFDYDGTMATLVANPVYFWFPQRLRIEGYAAVREMYVRLEPVTRLQVEKLATRNIHYMAYGENQLAAEIDFEYPFPDGVTRLVRLASFLKYDGELLLGETLYADGLFARVLDDVVFDAKYLRMPGVTRF